MNVRFSFRRAGAGACLATLAIAVSAAPAAAVQKITSCGTIVSSQNAQLDANLSFSGAGACVELEQGKNLNTNGFTITCTNGSGCGHAVLCDPTDQNNEASVVFSSKSNDGGHVDLSGPFTSAVEDCGQVKDLKIVGATTGIQFDDANSDGKKYFRNVLEDVTIGVSVKMGDNTDRVHDNRIDATGIGVVAIGSSSGSGPRVDHNVIRGFDTSGIFNNDSSHLRIEDNVLVDRGDDAAEALDVSSANASFDNNVCEVDSDCDCELDELTAPVSCL